MSKPIESIWDDLAHVGELPAHQRVSADHPLDLYAEVSPSGRVGLLLVCDEEPPRSPKYQSVDVEFGRRTDMRWTIRIILNRPELRSVFSHLCEDIIASTYVNPRVSKPGQFIIARLARWHRLLDLGANALNETEIRGLIGELLFIKRIIPLFGPTDSVTGWNGPFDAPQDFELSSGRFEIKAIHHGSPTVRINSLEQLDVTAGVLTLVVYDLEQVELSSPGVFTLASVVNDIRTVLDPEPLLLKDFESRLCNAGYQDRAEYSYPGYSVKDLRCFLVTSEFPRLTKSELHDAFHSATYDLLLAKCDAFRTATVGK